MSEFNIKTIYVDDVANFERKNEELMEKLMRVVCFGCDEETRRGCLGCTKRADIAAELLCSDIRIPSKTNPSSKITFCFKSTNPEGLVDMLVKDCSIEMLDDIESHIAEIVQKVGIPTMSFKELAEAILTSKNLDYKYVTADYSDCDYFRIIFLYRR